MRRGSLVPLPQVDVGGSLGGPAYEVHFHLQSDTQYLDELNGLLSSLFLFSGLTQSQVKQLTTAVRELGTNAIEWGHQKQVDMIVDVTSSIIVGVGAL